MQKTPNRFSKTVVVFIDGDTIEASGITANALCATLAEENYITDVFSIESPLRTFATVLGWNGVSDEKGEHFVRSLDKVVRDYNPKFWISLLINSLQDHSSYPHDVIFIYGNTTKIEKNLVKEDSLYRVVTISISNDNENKLEFEPADYNYTLRGSDIYSDLMKNCRTILDNILTNFSKPMEER